MEIVKGPQSSYLILGKTVHSETDEEFAALIGLSDRSVQVLCPRRMFGYVKMDFEQFRLLGPPGVLSGIYRHFKHGNLYRSFGEFVRIDTGEVLVAYVALYAPFMMMARPRDMFLEVVERPEQDYRGPRFTLIRPS